MSGYIVSYYGAPDMAMPGHNSELVHVHQTRVIGLHCRDCGWFGGSFRPDRWRDKHMRQAWQKHADFAAAGGVIEHGQASNVDDKMCVCNRCMAAWRSVLRGDAA